MIQNKSDSCFNCGEALKNEENFCPNCGQINTDLNISVTSLIKEFASDYFSFDSKLFKTLWPLITKPGHVPKEYIDGLRVRHIPPLRMFLFLSFISFFLWGLSLDINPINKKEKGPFLMLDSLNRNISNNQAFIDSINLENGLDIQLTEDSSINSINSTSLQYILNKRNDPKEITDSIANDVHPLLKKIIYQSLRMYQAEKGTVRPYLMGNLSIVLLIFQPFFALLLFLFYVRRKSLFYIEHLVFSLYFHSFILLGIILLFFLTILIDIDFIILWIFFFSSIYLILSIKYFYLQSWAKSIFKSLLISFIYLVFLFPIFIIAYLAISLYFY